MNKIKIAFLFFGFLLLYILIKKIGFGAIVEQFKSLGWSFLLLMVFPIIFQQLLFALAWQYSLNGPVPGFFKVLLANIAGESVSYITPGTFVGGEPLRAYLLRHHAGVHSSTASVIISRTTKAISMVIFVVVSLLIFLYFHQVPLALKVALIIIILLLVTGIFIFFSLQKAGLFNIITNWFNRIKFPGSLKNRINGFLEEKGHHLLKLDDHLIDFYKKESGRFYFSLFISFLAWPIGALEIFLFLKFLGLSVTPLTALTIEALSLVINACFVFMPGGVGTQEAGKVFIFKLLFLSAETGLTIGLLRRIRELAWTCLGLGIFALYKTSTPVEQKV